MDDLERLKEASLTSEQLETLAIRFPTASEIAKADVAQRLLHTARYLQARAEAAEKTQESLDVLCSMRADEIAALKARVRELESNQRTPGTVEVCPVCRAMMPSTCGGKGIDTLSVMNGHTIEHKPCPLRSVSPS